MTAEEQIKQAVKQYADNIVDIEGKDKFSASYITDFDRHYDVEQAFQDGVIFGREIGMKEAFEWIPVSERLPEVKDHPYTVMATDKPHDHFGIMILPIHNRGSVEHIEISWKFWRPIKLEDMP